MLQPIPGMVYLQAVAPRTEPRRSTPTSFDSHAVDDHVRVLVKIALEVACLIRPLSHLARASFGPAVRTHLAAHLRKNAVSGPVRIVSIHSRPGADGHTRCVEVFGTAVCAGRRFAFAGRAYQKRPGKLLAFRVASVAA